MFQAASKGGWGNRSTRLMGAPGNDRDEAWTWRPLCAALLAPAQAAGEWFSQRLPPVLRKGGLIGEEEHGLS